MSKMRTKRMQPTPKNPSGNKSSYKQFSSFAPKPNPTQIDYSKGVKSNSGGMMDLLNVPQKLMTKQFTGKYEGPGDALERKGMVGSTGRDIINFVADPINAIPLAKVSKGRYMKVSKANNKAIKYNSKVKKIKKASNAAQVSEAFIKNKNKNK